MAFSAIPCVATGARLLDEAFRVAVAMRFDAPVGFACPCQCGSELDELGEHAICSSVEPRALQATPLSTILSPTRYALQDSNPS